MIYLKSKTMCELTLFVSLSKAKFTVNQDFAVFFILTILTDLVFFYYSRETIQLNNNFVVFFILTDP